jgi:hypothetical protein
MKEGVWLQASLCFTNLFPFFIIFPLVDNERRHVGALKNATEGSNPFAAGVLDSGDVVGADTFDRCAAN